MPPLNPDHVAGSVLDTFDNLPTKYGPRQLPNGRREWVPLAGIVLSRALHRAGRIKDHDLTCVALATGMKCLPHSKVNSANGNVLHDWHAEILAIRTFNRFLVDECADLARKSFGAESAWVKWRENVEIGEAEGWQGQPFALKDDVKIHMYCSEAPCGDASMELTMAEQEDATPWSSTPSAEEKDGMPGRGHFDQLGVVRRKPARPDAPVTLSKSCSDKMALKQCTGLLSSVVSLLVHPGNVYLETVVMPQSQSVSEALRRSFGESGRMKELACEKLQSRWRRGGFAFKPFKVMTTSREFHFSKRGLQLTVTPNVSSNLSAVYTPRRQETLVNGVLQGRKQLDPKGASCTSRRKLWRSVLDVALLVGIPALTSTLEKRTYLELKDSDVFIERESVKRDARDLALKGWIRNAGDEQWTL